MLPFEVDGRQHPVLRVLAPRIVEHLDVVEHILPGLGPGTVGPAPYPFSLEQIEEALCHGVVMTVPAPAHLTCPHRIKPSCSDTARILATILALLYLTHEGK